MGSKGCQEYNLKTYSDWRLLSVGDIRPQCGSNCEWDVKQAFQMLEGLDRSQIPLKSLKGCSLEYRQKYFVYEFSFTILLIGWAKYLIIKTLVPTYLQKYQCGL